MYLHFYITASISDFIQILFILIEKEKHLQCMIWVFIADDFIGAFLFFSFQNQDNFFLAQDENDISLAQDDNPSMYFNASLNANVESFLVSLIR